MPDLDNSWPKSVVQYEDVLMIQPQALVSDFASVSFAPNHSSILLETAIPFRMGSFRGVTPQ